MMIKQLAHINILADDLTEIENFYCNILGLEKGFDFIKDGELFGFYVKLGTQTFIEIFRKDYIAIDDRPLIHHLCLEVENIDETIAHIRQQGWQITDKKQGGDQSWQAWITDPSGVKIELMQYIEASSQFTGNPCIVDW